VNDLPAAGRLLVASPTLEEPTFARSVILLLDHDEDGTLGVVLNRPTEVPVGQVLPTWQQHTSSPEVLFRGGPVALDSALGLGALLPARPTAGGEDPGAVLGWRPLVGSLGLIDLDAPPELLTDGLRALRIFAGYAGWGSGQLDDELAVGAWYVVDSEPLDAFSAAPEELWRVVLRRQRGELAFLSTYPPDPSLN
jgi:putative transcriptional regulator